MDEPWPWWLPIYFVRTLPWSDGVNPWPPPIYVGGNEGSIPKN